MPPRLPDGRTIVIIIREPAHLLRLLPLGPSNSGQHYGSILHDRTIAAGGCGLARGSSDPGPGDRRRRRAGGAPAAAGPQAAVHIDRGATDRARGASAGPAGRRGAARRPSRARDQAGDRQDHHLSDHRHDARLHLEPCGDRRARHGGRSVDRQPHRRPRVLSQRAGLRSARHWPKRSPSGRSPRRWTSP